jgi:tRNA(Arg) A34 adenosine deaminase TadA
MFKAICKACGDELDVTPVSGVTGIEISSCTNCNDCVIELTVLPCANCISKSVETKSKVDTKIKGVYYFIKNTSTGNIEKLREFLKSQVKARADVLSIEINSLSIRTAREEYPFLTAESDADLFYLWLQIFCDKQDKIELLNEKLRKIGFGTSYVWYMGKYVGND